MSGKCCPYIEIAERKTSQRSLCALPMRTSFCSAIQDMAEMGFLPYLATLHVGGVLFSKVVSLPKKKEDVWLSAPHCIGEVHPNAFSTCPTFSSLDGEYERVEVLLFQNLVGTCQFQTLILQKVSGK